MNDNLLSAIKAYVGSLDDPNIGWTGSGSSHPDLFKCERCGSEHSDCTKIEHKEGCTAKALIEVLSNMRQ